MSNASMAGQRALRLALAWAVHEAGQPASQDPDAPWPGIAFQARYTHEDWQEEGIRFILELRAFGILETEAIEPDGRVL